MNNYINTMSMHVKISVWDLAVQYFVYILWSGIDKFYGSSIFNYVRKCYTLFHMVSHFSPGWHFVIPWTVTWQAPLFMGFSRQEYWSGFPFPSPVTAYLHSHRYLSIYVSNCFQKCFQVFFVQYFASIGSFILRHCILSVVMINGTISLIFLSNPSLTVYRMQEISVY